MAIGSNADPALRSLAVLLARCEVACAGCDGGGLDDLFALAVVGREKNSAAPDPAQPAGRGDEDPAEGEIILPRPSGRWLHWCHAWAHPIVLERRKEIAPRLQDFAADGDLTIVERVGDDVLQAADYIEQVRDSGLFPDKNAIGVDPAGIGAFLKALDDRGFDTTPDAGFVVGIPQGWKLQTAIKTTERMLAGGDFIHGGTRLMSWAVGNAKVEPRGNAILITKQVSGFAKIDPLMATLNANALMSLNPSGVSIYEEEERGFMVL
jgi:phage terminase large subunit-like protein